MEEKYPEILNRSYERMLMLLMCLTLKKAEASLVTC